MGISGYWGEEGNKAPIREASAASRSPERRLILWAIALSGFAAMLYEVAWTRLLALVLGSSSHGFAAMLLTFISGIAAGSWLAEDGWSDVVAAVCLSCLEILVGTAVFLSLFLFEYLPYWFARLADVLRRPPEAYPLYHLAQVAICFLVMFMPTRCLGMILPLASRMATEEVSQTEAAGWRGVFGKYCGDGFLGRGLRVGRFCLYWSCR